MGDDGVAEVARATRWRLRIPAGWEPVQTFATGGTPIASSSLSGASARGDWRLLDACRWRGLGLNAPRILDVLSAGPKTAAELSEALGLSVGHLRSRLLPRLEGFALVQRTDGGGWQVVDDLFGALEAAAEALDLSGKAAEVSHQHAEERERYLQYREETRPLRQLARRRAIATRMAQHRQAVPDAPPDDLSAEDRPVYASQSAPAPEQHPRGANAGSGPVREAVQR